MVHVVDSWADEMVKRGLCWAEICLFLFCGGDTPGPQVGCGYCGYCAAHQHGGDEER